MEDSIEHPIEIKPKKPKKTITAKQREARIENLKKGRERRLANIKEKKTKQPIQYDLGSDTESDSDPEIDMDSYVLSRKEKNKPKIKEKQSTADDIRKEIQELRSVVFQIAKKKQKPRKEKVVLLPPQPIERKDKQSHEYNVSLQNMLAAFGKK